MQLGDIPLKHFRQGIRVASEQGEEGTLRWNLDWHWHIAWDNGRNSVIGALDEDAMEMQYYDLNVVTKNSKIVIHTDWFLCNEDVYAYQENSK